MDTGMPWGELLVLAGTLLAAGVVTGLLAGLLGIGGGAILVPVLYEVFGALGVDEAVRMHLAVGTSLAVIVPTSLRSFAGHHARGAVDLDLVKSMALPVIAGVGLGAVLARHANQDVLQAIWVAAASLISLKLILGRQDWQLGGAVPGQPFRALYGGFVGLVSTLMSIGGGIFITALMTLYGQPMQRAVATSSAFGPIIAVPGTLGFVWAGWQAAGLPPGSLGYVSVLGALVISPTSVLAAPVGVRIAHGISRRKLELAFATFLVVVALRFLFSLIR
ncbi:MAG TPA: sulfite exporter TauE/SafE family protein [Geminicoccaceae bacterium]